MRGFLVGSLLLIALEVFVSGKGPDKAVGIIGWGGTALDRLLSPDVAGIPQLRNTGGGSSSSLATYTTPPTVPNSGTSVAGITNA